MKIVIPGGSGHVGTVLARAFHCEGADVVVLSRHPHPEPWRVVWWDGVTLGPWAEEIDGCDVVINLAGRSVNCRYSPPHRSEILASRLTSTQVVGAAIAQAQRPPGVWLQASTATIYSHRCDAANDEQTGILGGHEPDVPRSWRFSIDVAHAWERAFDAAVTPHTRKVCLRSAMMMSPGRGGIFDTLLTLVRRGLGGAAGTGGQYVSWIHFEDFVRAMRWLIGRGQIEGVVNVAAPYPLPNREFMRVLRNEARMPFGLPASRWMLEVGALIMRTETELLLKSRRVAPTRLLEAGFTFQFPTWQEAARDLCARSRASTA